jgi:hypothetical protein
MFGFMQNLSIFFALAPHRRYTKMLLHFFLACLIEYFCAFYYPLAKVAPANITASHIFTPCRFCAAGRRESYRADRRRNILKTFLAQQKNSCNKLAKKCI